MAWHTARVDKAGSVSNKCTIFHHERPPSPKLEILAFETAKTMSRLVALYKSLSDDEFFKLRTGPMKSTGVAVLNSTNESYLLGLACKEKFDDLDQAASIVSRLGKKCTVEELNRFEFAYHKIKQGIIDVSNLHFNSRNVGKIIEKMQKYANATSILYASLAALNELEISEKNMQKWKRNGCPKKSSERTNIDYFNKKISFQRKQVQHFRQISLWSQTFDKSVGLMAQIVCVVYARICTIFGPFVPSLPRSTKNRHFHTRLVMSNPKTLHMKVYPGTNYSLLVNKEKYKKQASKSAPIMKTSRIKPGSTRFHSRELSPEDKSLGFRISAVTITDKVSSRTNKIEGKTRRNQKLIHSAPDNTVGAAGLAVRYANVITMAESYFYSTTTISDEAREHMFEMLPISLKHRLRGKLKSHWCKEAEEREGQQDLAVGWREAFEAIIGWLAPVAHDTLRWQQDRNLEQQKLDAKPTVLLLQTLHFSDLEITEAAIVEVLVGLSYIYKYESRRERSGVGYSEPNVTLLDEGEKKEVNDRYCLVEE
ncbi:uncharacterized protein LOC111297846 [Durio zibethinus]|uniref:Uncharacterized protein LOC111297846 n=1 Tax=Durio zibethinus TaxID=66656 RepID=A0A6P5Z632_DURZI|nr:uncharacterized protein LOC111297846 [Durio zibethinus]